MISRPDNEIVKKIPKKASFTVLLSHKLLSKLGNESADSADIGKYSLILENPKENDPVKEKKDVRKAIVNAFLTHFCIAAILRIKYFSALSGG